MRAQILALFGVTLAAALAELMAPGGENGGIRRAFRFLTAAAVLLLILTPFMGFLRGLPDLTLPDVPVETTDRAAYESLLARTVSAASAPELQAGLARYLGEKWGVDPAECGIFCEFDGSGELRRITVRLHGAALLRDPAPMEADLLEKFGCEVRVQ